MSGHPVRTVKRWGTILEEWSAEKWQLTVLGGVAIAHFSVLLRVLLLPGRPPMRPDSAIFEYAGWYMSRGAPLYTGIWEIKLPLAYETPAVLAFLSGGSMLAYHLLNILLTTAVSVGAGYLVARLVRDITGDRTAAIAAGLGVLLLPGYFYLPAFGFKAKFFVAFTALLSIYLVRNESYLLAGGAAAACVGYYQAAAIIPIIAVAMGYQYDRWRGATEVVTGGLSVTAVMIAPVVVSGATEAMITEAVLIPLFMNAGESTSLFLRLYYGYIDVGIGAPGVLLGGVGVLLSVTEYDWRDTWWVVAGATWFGFVLLFFDYDSYPDLIPGLVFVAIGLGILVSKLDSPPRRRLVVVGLLVCTLGNVVAVVSVGGVFGVYGIEEAPPLSESGNVTYQLDDGAYSVDRPDVRYLYWNRIESDTCHIRLSPTELEWLHRTGKPLIDTQCGNLDRGIELL